MGSSKYSTEKLVAFSEIDMVYEDMDWKRVLQSRRKEKERIRKRNQRVKSLSPLTTPLASCENIKLSPEEVLAGIRSKNRAYKRKSRAQRKKSASSEELEKLRIKSRIQEAVSKTKRKAALSPEELEVIRVRNRCKEARSKAKKIAASSPEELEDMRLEKRRKETASKAKKMVASSPEELEAMRLENRKKKAKSTAKRKALLLPEELEAMRKRHQVSVALGRDRRKREEMTQDPILPTIKTSLEIIINGEKPLMTLDELPETKKLQKDFLKKCESKQMEFCRTCKKRWWDLKIDGSGICKNCRVDLANPKVRISKLSKENKMDPFPNGYPTHLPELNSIEQAMISRVQVIMKCYRLKDGGFGGFGYRGHVMNFEHDPSKIFDQLPVAFKDLPIIILRKRDDKHPKKYRDFRVRRKAIQSWLEYLIEHSPAYQDVTIAADRLQSLPDDDCVSDRVLTQFEEEVVDNEEPKIIDENSPVEDDLEVEDFVGPEQGGASGDGDQEPVKEQFLFTPPDKHPNDEETQMEPILKKGCKDSNDSDTIVVNMQEPEISLSDFSQPFIQAMAFPTLFPYGFGDVTGKDRDFEVSMTEANQHLLKYCERLGGKFKYRFAEHNTHMHWAQNRAERHRCMSQKLVYINKNPEDDNLTEEELQSMLDEGGSKLEKLVGRMQTYNSNISGSNAYFNKKKRELHALIAQEGMCTLWFTFSAADNHWKDLFRLILGESEASCYKDKNEKEKATLRRQLRRQNPHIVDAYFHERLEELLKSFFGRNSALEAKWYWFRIEYQGRGSAHGHGCCRLVCDPGIIQLSEKVLKGRQALQVIQMLDLKVWKK